MALDRRAGRQRRDGLGYPAGCSALDDKPRAGCTASLHGSVCLLCRRIGDVPGPVRYEGAHYACSVMESRSVQVIKGCGPAAPWLVATFVSGNWLDPQWPVIVCGNSGLASEIALLRARQLEPTAPIKRLKDGGLRIGGVLVPSIPEAAQPHKRGGAGEWLN